MTSSTWRSRSRWESCCSRRIWSCAAAARLPWLAVPPIPHVDVKAQYAPLIPELKEAFARVLESGRFIFGPEVDGFERDAADYLAARQAIGVANGTDALVIALDALGIRERDAVV